MRWLIDAVGRMFAGAACHLAFVLSALQLIWTVMDQKPMIIQRLASIGSQQLALTFH